MNCDSCSRPINYCFYINDYYWAKVVGEDKFEANVGQLCAHCTLERLGGLDWYIIHNEVSERQNRHQVETVLAASANAGAAQEF